MNPVKFIALPNLTTKRLALRQLFPEDDRELYALRSDDRVNQYINRPKPASIEEVQAFIQNLNAGVQHREWMYWAISRRTDFRLIGTICLWNIVVETSTAEIGYELSPAVQGQGIMLEALEEVIAFGFQAMNLKKIEAWTHRENTASIRLLEKTGFKEDEQVKAGKPNNTDEQEMITFSLGR
ncbi:MAG: GNAT family N-acetyltransferase [Lewinellaceae bacterium]|jgi:ribosomal-protein-alanine N-acetyltransferase|nr:GNAT family N-acetyltransferase [Lewinellaceae bacterium]